MASVEAGVIGLNRSYRCRRPDQNGVGPPLVSEDRIAENIDIFDFVLTIDDIAAIDAIDKDVRGGPNPESVDAKLFNLSIED